MEEQDLCRNYRLRCAGMMFHHAPLGKAEELPRPRINCTAVPSSKEKERLKQHASPHLQPLEFHTMALALYLRKHLWTKKTRAC